MAFSWHRGFLQQKFVVKEKTSFLYSSIPSAVSRGFFFVSTHLRLTKERMEEPLVELLTEVKTLSTAHGMEGVRGSVIRFQSVSYHLNSSVCSLPFRKKSPKQILYDLSGIFRPGMNAIMGPTGSGKSSLLDILPNRKDRQGLQGNILLNGQTQGDDYKYRVGYAVQDDIVSGMLTVRENLMFSAHVRLSVKIPSQEKKRIVDKVLLQLGLEKCAETRVGNELQRGVSGGERKRTNIGMELVLSPDVLFLDEPTTGSCFFSPFSPPLFCTLSSRPRFFDSM